MTRPEEVKAFAREFINGERTRERRMKISEALFQLTGDRLRVSCETCYIEAIFKIIKLMERKPCKYRLLKGAVIQPFGEGYVTNDNLTDELAEKCLRTVRGCASLFDKMPEDAPEFVDPTIVPVKNEPVEKENKEANIPAPETKYPINKPTVKTGKKK